MSAIKTPGRHAIGPRAGHMNQDSGLRFRMVRIPCVTAAGLFSAAAIPVVNVPVTLLAGGSVPWPANFCLRFIADATVQTRSVTVLIQGRDQFGKPINEILSFTATASATVDTYTAKVYSKITSITPTVVTNVAAGDTMAVGPNNLAASTKFGIGLEIRTQADILSLSQEAAAGTIAIFNSTAAVVNVPALTVQTFTGITLTNATFLVLTVFSSEIG